MFIRLKDGSVYEIAGDLSFHTENELRVCYTTTRGITANIPASNLDVISKIQPTGIVNNDLP